ncbi:extracellular solute-binding protein [Paenibacillus lignilyticus]|uniref:Extracellular solute-binding protein n=1 Tax=Paenibacillus lignilyticus TaxID=1172615 RepID=A0ABS5CA80_9BACL|nr:extracellular solute-binding protein [Paenibacillus lignilyticus]MBP3962839.1 extracellular solute-binding protein [Paenibacillus lignilyticus]
MLYRHRTIILVSFLTAVLLLAAACLFVVFDKKAEGKQAEPPIVIKAAVPSFARERNTMIDLEYERLTQLKFDWIQFPVNDYIKRIKQLLASSGEKPDIFIIDKDMVQRFGPQGMLLDLQPYLDRMPNLQRWISKYPQIYRSIVTEDGKLYGIDGFNTYGQMPVGYMLRADIFYRNGMLLPKTFDELYDSLKQLKNMYPDSKPISNRWGPNRLLESFFMAYHTHYGIYFNNEDLSYKFGPVESNYKKAVELARKFYEAKLIDPDFATTAESQYFENITSGKTFAIFNDYFIEMDGWQEKGKKQDSFFNLKAVLPFITDTGLQALEKVQYPNTQGTWVIAINAKSKHIDELIRLLDAQYSAEMMELVNWGIEGDTFVWANGERTYTSKIQTKLNPKGTVPPQQLGIDGRTGIWVPYDQDAEYKRSWGALGLEAQQSYNENASRIGFFDGPAVPFKQDELNTITKIMTPLDKFITGKLIKFVTGELNMDSDWNSFQEELGRMGYQRVLDMYREKFAKLPEDQKKLNKTIR